MTQNRTISPPFSPILLAGMGLRAVPLAVVQPAIDQAMSTLHRRHPEVFERLADLDNPVFLIDPVDLPIRFVMRPDPLIPTLEVIGESDPVTDASAIIRGPLANLIELLEGRSDGDAQFFSRSLIIEGDTEHVVALRNAVDGADIDVLTDLLSSLGPLATPARGLADGALRLFGRMQSDMTLLGKSITAPAMRRGDAQDAAMRRLEEKIDKLARRRQPGRTLPKVKKT